MFAWASGGEEKTENMTMHAGEIGKEEKKTSSSMQYS